jgi:lysozyme-like protein
LAGMLIVGCSARGPSTQSAAGSVAVARPTSASVQIAPITIHINVTPTPSTSSLPVVSGQFTPPMEAFSPVDRYRLALDVGFTPGEALLATAISLSENASGNPALVSLPNRGGTVDIGLMQINSSHCGDAGGCEALKDPVVNMREALKLYRQGGWFLWCTFPGGCGGLPGSPNWLANLATATAVAQAAGR